MNMMAKTVSLILSSVLAASPVLAAGTIPLSFTQQFDTQGLPLSGCKLYTYATGTTTPQNSYQDSGLTVLNSWPLECDASGRLPQFFYADGAVKVRLADKNGVTVLSADGVLVIGPSGGGGGGASVDATAIYQTGDLKIRYGTGTHTGWVRANARTIGNATSGGTERAHADTQALWEYICSNDTILRATISGGGYSGNCTTDYNANKTIQLPDWRGAAIAGLDDMGNSAAGRLTATYFGTSATVLGAFGGAESKTFLQANLPNVNFSVSTATPTIPYYVGTAATTATSASGVSMPTSVTNAGTISVSGQTAASGGSGTPLAIVQPTRLATIYMKL